MNQKKMFKKIISDFNRNKIKYCILRNYEFLTDSHFAVESLDTVVASKDMARLDEIFKENGFKKRKEPQFSLKHHSYFGFTYDANTVSFDIQEGGVHWNDMEYIGESILKNRVKHNYFYVPSKEDYVLMLLVHSILGKRLFKPKYKNLIYDLAKDKNLRIKLLKRLIKIFNTRIASDIVSKIENKSLDRVKFRRIVLFFITSDPKKSFTFICLFLRWIKWKKFLKPKPLISVVGPDGAGKSSLTNELYAYLRSNNRQVEKIYTGRGRENILPMTKLGKKYKSSEKKEDLKHKTPKNSSIKRKLLYIGFAPVFALDLYLRYIFRIFPSRMEKNIVITDRYCSDIILMENVPFWFKNILLQVFPKPTISIYVYNSAEELHKRRPEESVKELKRQMKIFDKFRYSLRLKTTKKKKNTTLVKEFVMTKLRDKWN